MNKKNTPLHICHVLPTLQFGGAERCVIDLINYRKDPSLRYTLIVCSDNQPMRSQIRDTSVNIITVPKKGKLGWHLIADLQKTFVDIKPDVIHSHLFDIWPRLAAARSGIPLVTTWHNIVRFDSTIKRLLLRRYASYSRAYAACSQAVADDAQREYGVTTSATVIQYGIPYEQFAETSSLSATRTTLRCVMIGRLVEQKGQEIGIAALARMRDIPWTLSIVGDGPLLDHLRTVVRHLGVTDRVTFVPSTADVAAVLASHDILLMPSRWEGLGIVILEAMAAGRIVVASGVDGIPEVVVDNNTGFLVRPHTAVAFEKVLRRVWSGWGEMKDIAQAAQARVRERYTVERMVTEYEQWYRTVLQ